MNSKPTVVSMPAVSQHAHRPLQWWSHSHLQKLSQTLDAVWQAWCADWDVDSAGAVAVLNAFESPLQDTITVSAKVDWEALNAGAWLGCAHAPVDLLHGCLFGKPQSDVWSAASVQAPAVGLQVAQQAWTALRSAWTAALSEAARASIATEAIATSPASPPAFHNRPWSGAVVCKLPLWVDSTAHDVWLHLAPALAVAWMADGAPQSKRAQPQPDASTLVPINQALAGHTVRLRVELNEAELDVGSLQSLRIGDVLTLPHALDAPLTVKSLAPAHARTLCHAHLGARAGHRAVELVRGMRNDNSPHP